MRDVVDLNCCYKWEATESDFRPFLRRRWTPSIVFYCNKAHYRPVSGGGAGDRIKAGQVVVGSGWHGFGGDDDGISGGKRDGGGGGDGWDRYGLSQWEDNISHMNLGTDTNSPLAFDLGLELHHPIMSMLGGHGCRLNR